MFSNYFKTAWRSLWRNGQFTAINIAGLALGIAVFLLITEYVAGEWAANRFNKSYNQLCRANVQYKEGNTDNFLPPGFAPILKKQFPAIENFVRVSDGIGAGLLTYQGKTEAESRALKGGRVLYADSNFLNVFSFPVLAGATTLRQPKTLALSEEKSRSLFGKEPAIGKTVMVSNQFGNTPYTVTAVYRQPEASDIQADVLLSLQTLDNAANRDGNDWADPATTGSGYTNIYLQLRPDVNVTALSTSITQYIRSINPDSKDDAVYLQPFSEMHLAPSFDYPFQTFGNLLMVVVFAAIAVLILIIAWVNYINLSVAQSLNRAKEIGVRKVLGAGRRQLMLQYLTETALLTTAATGIALLLVYFFQNPFNDFTGKSLSLRVLNNGPFLLLGMALILLGSLLAGGYTGFVLTAFKPATALRYKAVANARGFSLRKALVVFQFTISVVLIVATVVIYKQLQFMKGQDLGMKLNHLLVIAGPSLASEEQADRNAAFKNSLAQLPFVKKQAGSNNVPGIGFNFTTNGITPANPQKDDEKKSYSMFICDQNFFDTWGIQFAQGAAFSQEDAERSWNNIRKVIINQKAAQVLGFNTTENLIGKKILWGEPFEIIGVVKDYHHLSLREEIKPAIYLGSVSYSFFTVQIDGSNLSAKINTLQTLYRQAFPGNPFEYFFADEKFNQQYQADQKLGAIFIAAACVAIFIACLGLFGLAAFTARQRVKEIGIRKVLGATVADITSLLSKDFVKLVFMAIVIASPVAWWAMHKWLQDFAYRTPVSWWLFVAAGAVALLIALVTVSFQAVKAARANPMKNLRTE